MATRLPRRPTPHLTLPITSYGQQPLLLPKPSHTPLSRTPSRAATLIRRPRRPYAFTQLVQLSDGSTYTVRTSSPLGLYKSTKDTRNHALWNPNEKTLQNVEVDEAGKLAAFRSRFGHGWDAGGGEDANAASAGGGGGGGGGGNAAGEGSGAGTAAAEGSGGKSGRDQGGEDALADLISGYAAGIPELPPSAPPPPKNKKE
ncbi:hypothetical protein F5B18DRAFT_21845 [Nemania serpens]|nr:hypothetical protein F5B18DRAFT_21845 [Nemania serpens]